MLATYPIDTTLLTISSQTAGQTSPSPAHHVCYTFLLPHTHQLLLHFLLLLPCIYRPHHQDTPDSHTRYSLRRCSIELVEGRDSEAYLEGPTCEYLAVLFRGLGDGLEGRGGKEEALLLSD
jgi:hypothetical protein